jgi:hypothetical protein
VVDIFPASAPIALAPMFARRYHPQNFWTTSTTACDSFPLAKLPVSALSSRLWRELALMH